MAKTCESCCPSSEEEQPLLAPAHVAAHPPHVMVMSEEQPRAGESKTAEEIAAEQWVIEHFPSLVHSSGVLMKMPFTHLDSPWETVNFDYLTDEEKNNGRWVKNLTMKGLVENLLNYAVLPRERERDARCLKNIVASVRDAVTFQRFDSGVEADLPHFTNTGQVYFKSSINRAYELRDGMDPVNNQPIEDYCPFRLIIRTIEELYKIPDIKSALEEDARLDSGRSATPPSFDWSVGLVSSGRHL